MHPPALRRLAPTPALSHVFLGVGQCSLGDLEELHTTGVLLRPPASARKGLLWSLTATFNTLKNCRFLLLQLYTTKSYI